MVVVVEAYRRAGGKRGRIGGGFLGGRWETSGKADRSILLHWKSGTGSGGRLAAAVLDRMGFGKSASRGSVFREYTLSRAVIRLYSTLFMNDCFRQYGSS